MKTKVVKRYLFNVIFCKHTVYIGRTVGRDIEKLMLKAKVEDCNSNVVHT